MIQSDPDAGLELRHDTGQPSPQRGRRAEPTTPNPNVVDRRDLAWQRAGEGFRELRPASPEAGWAQGVRQLWEAYEREVGKALG
jgi:hypothetical protein